MKIPGVLNQEAFSVVKNQIKSACVESNRSINEVQIIAVTKTFDIIAIEAALNAGIYCIGENKVQEVEFKIPQIQNRQVSEIHFIGHLQSNKVRKILKYVDVIETVDSIKIAKRINSISEELDIVSNIYIQVNTGNDPLKYGFQVEEIMGVASNISKMKNLNLTGIMTIPSINNSYQKLNTIFKNTRRIRDDIQSQINSNCKYLSMGMSGDFELAIKNGATHIRLGTALFGKRN